MKQVIPLIVGGFVVFLGASLEAGGKRLQVRDHGPAWVVYPWSDHAEISREFYARRSVWQLATISIR